MKTKQELLTRIAELESEINQLRQQLKELREEADDWERTAKRLASQAGFENSDYLVPD